MSNTTCGGCYGSGIHAHFPQRKCDFCNGTGSYVDECRVELADAISDRMQDTNDMDVSFLDFARAVVALLEERGMDVRQVARP